MKRIRRVMRTLQRRNRFGSEEKGAVTVEFVIWMPVFLLILAFTADACLMYLIQADMWNVARDTARRMSTGQLTSTAAQTYASGQLLYQSKPYTITATSGTDDVVDISVPMTSASVFGILAIYGGFSGAVLDAKVTMRAES